VILSKTHWLDNKQVKFKRYKVFLQNRQTGQGGGVAILVRKSIISSCLPLPQLEHIEATGIKIKLNDRYLDIISAYCPHGDCNVEEVANLFATVGDSAIIAGDFNGHSPQWESRCHRPNRAGITIEELMANEDRFQLATPSNLKTRRNDNNTFSTIDLTFITAD